jgi:hypothetical protein
MSYQNYGDYMMPPAPQGPPPSPPPSHGGGGGVTMLDDLPELQQLERSMPNEPRGLSPDNYSKFIRGPMRMDPQAGMVPFNPPPLPPPPQMNLPPPPPPMNRMLDPLNISCIDISRHIQDCPICCKIYNTSDKSLYLIIIIILSVLCLILLKKALSH